MADWDTADLVARCKRRRRRPDTDVGVDDEDWYAFLTEAESEWKPVIAQHFPEEMFGAPVQLTTSDEVVYTFPGVTESPLALVVMDSLNGYPLLPGPFWSDSNDYVWEGTTIRMCRNQPRSFPNGPYARFVSPPGTIDADTDSTILPARLRALLVEQACALQASAGGYDDPGPYEDRLKQLAFGDPNLGTLGLLGGLKVAHWMGGSEAIDGGIRRWWKPNG